MIKCVLTTLGQRLLRIPDRTFVSANFEHLKCNTVLKIYIVFRVALS